MRVLHRFRRTGLLALIVGLMLAGAVHQAEAQIEPNERERRTYIPPEQLVSFSSNTPFGQFISAVNPIMEQVTGKTIVDPADRSGSIGMPIAGMYFLDALEVVLEERGLTYRETDQYLIIEEPSQQASNQAGETQAADEGGEVPATARTREIEINAIFFEVNLTKARELGINWGEVFGGGSGGSTGGGGGAGGGTGGGSGQMSGSVGGLGFELKTDHFIDQIDEYVVGPDRIDFGTLTRIFRVFERENIGETVANPSVTVQSGEQGQIQIGSDIPIQIRDFAGNTTTEFVETGIIVDVNPTVLTDTVSTDSGDTTETERVEFIHLDVDVQKSSGQPSPSGTIITKSQAETEALLLNNEQTVIGGLYSTEKSKDRKGIPVLKDLPKWFFGLRYIFGFTQTQVTRKELLIVLQAELKDPLRVRARRDFRGRLRQQEREEFLERLERSGGNTEKYRHDFRVDPPRMPPPGERLTDGSKRFRSDPGGDRSRTGR